MKREINGWWGCMPLYAMLLCDDILDDLYVFNAFIFLFSLILLPFTLPLFLIGLGLRKLMNTKTDEDDDDGKRY